jgi:hypothetical protein
MPPEDHSPFSRVDELIRGEQTFEEQYDSSTAWPEYRRHRSFFDPDLNAAPTNAQLICNPTRDTRTACTSRLGG